MHHGLPYARATGQYSDPDTLIENTVRESLVLANAMTAISSLHTYASHSVIVETGMIRRSRP